MGKVISTQQLIVMAARASDAGLEYAPSPEFAQQLAPIAYHCVDNYVCIGDHVQMTCLFMYRGEEVMFDQPPHVFTIQLLREDFDSLPTQDQILAELRRLHE